MEELASIEEQFVALRKEYIETRFRGLNEMQRQAVFSTEGPLLILAGAGSGKTTVLVRRIANLVLFGQAYQAGRVNGTPSEADLAELRECIAQKTAASARLAPMLAVDPVRPWNVLAITFTNKAAGELKNRLAKILGEEMEADVNASTFHSACVRILRRDGERLGFPRSFTIYDADDQQRVLKELYKGLNIDDKFLPVKSCLGSIGRLKDRMVSPAEAAEKAGDTRAQLVAQVYMAYAKKCRDAGAMDFDDLIYYTVRLLREFVEVRDYYRNRFKYILVDEYQDTSVAQFHLVNLLCDEKNNVCVVGDDDQSIYRFRGATIENILSFEERFPGAKVIRLEQNYRSTSSILDAANCVIRNNAGRKGKTLWTDNGQGNKVQLFTAANEQDEAAHIADVIGENMRGGAKLRDHAVLYRMNAQSSPVENYFARGAIPYKIVGGLRFNDRKEVKDLHAYMSVVANPRDDLRLRRIINEPGRKIGAVTVDTVAEIAGNLGVPMLEVVRDAAAYPALSRASAALAGFYAVYEKLVELNETLPLDLFAAEVPEVTGYNNMLKAQGEEGKTRLENVGQLVSNVKTYADQHGAEASLEGYLEEIALISDIDNYDEEADRVVMMTMHAAKGLEFPFVFIVGLEEGIFPSDMSRWNDEDLEEERRLCYVGITRAKKELYLSKAESRLLYGQTRRNQQSRFVEEIDAQLLEEQTSPMASAGQMGGHFGFGDDEGAGGNFGRAAAGGRGYLNNEYNRPAGQKRVPSRAAGFGNGAGGFGGGTAAGNTGGVGGQSRSAFAYKPAGAPKPQNAGITFVPGDAVEHKVFGRGVVQKVTPVAGDFIVEIAFEGAGVKKTMANYAPLTKV